MTFDKYFHTRTISADNLTVISSYLLTQNKKLSYCWQPDRSCWASCKRQERNMIFAYSSNVGYPHLNSGLWRTWHILNIVS